MTPMELGRALLGGALIGAAATTYWFANSRVAGISGVLRNALVSRDDRGVAIPFLLGLLVAGWVGARVGAGPTVAGAGPSSFVPVLALSGLLVGLGTRLGGGCTSGHGVCGLARLSRRSLAATLTFIATGALTVFVVARWLPAWRLP
jgi:uncharacterized membrane protein YedE/YeeE